MDIVQVPAEYSSATYKLHNSILYSEITSDNNTIGCDLRLLCFWKWRNLFVSDELQFYLNLKMSR